MIWSGSGGALFVCFFLKHHLCFSLQPSCDHDKLVNEIKRAIILFRPCGVHSLLYYTFNYLYI